ncbi:MAG: aldolase/citrate lyase family protein [Eubacteriales bacterium]|nr:aldolase/citrate lyase family protein [Eubacteriales bacterium]
MILVEQNPMLEKMKRGEPVLGCQVRSRSTLIAEMIAYGGLDYVFIEGEHFVHNVETAENLIRAVQAADVVPIVRIPSHEDGLILQMLEAGAMGIIFPHIDTKEDALHAVREVKFAPLGNRGFGDSARASKFGFIPTDQYLKMVNENVMAIGMIESLEGIRNIDEILDAGLDVIRIGAKDLSLDMGFGGVVTPEVREKVVYICKKVRDSKVILGDAGMGGLASQSDFNEVCDLGCHMFTLGSDMALIKQQVVKKVAEFSDKKECFFSDRQGWVAEKAR